MAQNHRILPIRLVGVLLLALLVACPILVFPGDVRADDGPTVTVPDVRRRRIADARRVLEAAGLKVGPVYEFSLQRILSTWKVRGVVGTVFMQKPTPGSGWPSNKPVELVVAALKDGRLPADMPGVRKAADAKAADRKAAPPAAPVGRAVRGPHEPQAKGSVDFVPPDGANVDRSGEPIPPSPPGVDGPEAPRTGAPLTAVGSPDAPREAPKADPNRVPDLLGLELVEAEQLVRESQMKLHVERVPGHPVGRVLEQVPAGGSKRPPAGMLKVVVTAGGDFEARMPSPPAVYVADVALPGLLDRTKLQAERIVIALGLKPHFETAKRGLAGRVVDQDPAAGAKAPKGGIVTLWIGPGEGDSTTAAPIASDDAPPLGPLGAQPTSDAATPAKAAPKDPNGREAKADESTKPLVPGTLAAGIPQPVSPGVGTAIPVGAKVPLGFSWRGVTGANAYLVEVEEQGAEGRWLPLARKPARSTAVLMDIERFDNAGAARLRWRVTAIVSGRQGTPSGWILLK